MSNAHNTLNSEVLQEIIAIIGEAYVSVKDADLDQHARDQSFHAAHRPAAVIWPKSAEEISALLKIANNHRIPVTPWGAGTSLEGNPIPVQGGIVVDMLRMDELLEVDMDDFLVVVQAGARYKDMNAALGRQGLFFAPDPGANASIGGMIANNASGTRTLRYGSTKDNVLQLEVVLPTGEKIRTGTRSTKTSSGYDLVHLFVGSEGTLGIVTEATLKLAPLPEKFSAVIASFPDTQNATRTVSNIIGSGITPAALEFLDSATIQTLNASGEFELPEYPTLLLEFHSATNAGLESELLIVEQLCKEARCTNFESGLGRGERDRLWHARHQTYEILVRSNPERAFLIVDVAVPVSKYTALVSIAEEEIAKRGLSGYLVGHAGDGNLHPLIPYILGDETSYATALMADERIVQAAISFGGTATGEHGIGIGKRRFMLFEHGESLNIMQGIKNLLDPQGILNPGKIFPEPMFGKMTPL